MRDRPADTARAVGLAVLVHVAIVGLFLASMWWANRTRPVEEAGGMAAGVVAVGELSAAMQRTLQQRVEPVELPEPEPEPEPEPAPAAAQPEPQEVLPQPEDVDQDEVVDAPTPLATTETRVQPEKRRQQQVDLTRPPVQREQQQRTPPPRQVDQNRLEEIRRQRAESLRAQRMAAVNGDPAPRELQPRRSGSAAEESAAADAGASGGGSNQLRGLWVAAMLEQIEQKWVRPESVPSNMKCPIRIRLRSRGVVESAEVLPGCPFDALARDSVEKAVHKASPLPFEGFEDVYSRDFVVNFIAP